jgi:hypothetical protein
MKSHAFNVILGSGQIWYKTETMISYFAGFSLFLSSFFRSRCNLGLEILAPSALAWMEQLVIVKPETVVSWHRTGFRLFWRFRSRSKKVDRSQITAELSIRNQANDRRKRNLERSKNS